MQGMGPGGSFAIIEIKNRMMLASTIFLAYMDNLN